MSRRPKSWSPRSRVGIVDFGDEKSPGLVRPRKPVQTEGEAR